MTDGFSWQQRLRYWFDNTLARSMWAVLAWLGLVSFAFFLIVAGLLTLTGLGPNDEGTSFLEGLWFAMTRSLDPGTFSGDEGHRFRLVMLMVTVAGIFLAATIIGIVSSAIDTRVESLRRGRSLVIERGHSLIIGSSDKIPSVVSELVEANASEKNRAIVLLTPEDVVEVSDELRGAVPDLKTSRLVVRSGLSTRVSDLAQVNPQSARSAIVLRAEDGSDAQVVKSVLALSRCVPGLVGLTVVAELDDADTSDALKDAVGPNLITVTPKDIIARISAQVSRASGLGAIYQELLDFEGDEMYSTPVTAPWVGTNFGQALLASEFATIIGMRRADGTVLVNPPGSTQLAEGDFLIGIAEDDSVFNLDRPVVDWSPDSITAIEPLEKLNERTLLIGWSDLTPMIANEIETHVAAGSQLHVLVREDIIDDAGIHERIALTQQQLIIHRGDPIAGSDIVSVLDQGPFNHIMLLSERGFYSPEDADARTLLSLMHVRRHPSSRTSGHNVVAELLDPNDVELGGPTQGNDFIVSQKLIGLLMAQLSESPHLAEVFADLFDSDGSVVALHPVDRYLAYGTHTFDDVIAAARDCGVVAIGYRAASAANDPKSIGEGIRVNPTKSQHITFAPGDMIVVIAAS